MMEELILKVPAGRICIKDGRCPAGHSLMAKDKLMDGKPAIVAEVRLKGRAGTIYLNPFYGKFGYECDLPLTQDDIVALACPTCGVSLAVEQMCRLCNIPMFAVHLPDGGQVEACPRIGCHNHSLTIIDMDAQLDRYYGDETRFKM